MKAHSRQMKVAVPCLKRRVTSLSNRLSVELSLEITLKISHIRGSFTNCRNKVKLRTKIAGCVKYWPGLSLRKVARLVGVSHESVRRRFGRIARFNRLVTKCVRELIVLDETRLDGCYVFIARDVRAREIVTFWISPGSTLDVFFFLRRVLSKCANRPHFVVDRAP
jgi:transposase-like protein